MPGEDRLEKMRAMAAAAQVEKENNAKEAAERAAREQEGKGAERAEVEQALAGATAEFDRLGVQLAEAEGLAGQMAELPTEARTEFDAELTALRSEAEAVRTRLTELTAQKAALDVDLKRSAEPSAETQRVDFLPGINIDTFRTPEGRYEGFYLKQEEQRAVDSAIQRALDVYKIGTIHEVASTKNLGPKGSSWSAPTPDRILADIHRSLWTKRVARLKPEFQAPFLDEAVIAVNVLSATRENVVNYRKVIAEDRQNMERRKAELEETPKDQKTGAWIGHMHFAETRLKELADQTKMFDALERIPGFFNLTEQRAKEKNPEARKKVESQIEALLSQ